MAVQRIATDILRKTGYIFVDYDLSNAFTCMKVEALAAQANAQVPVEYHIFFNDGAEPTW